MNFDHALVCLLILSLIGCAPSAAPRPDPQAKSPSKQSAEPSADPVEPDAKNAPAASMPTPAEPDSPPTPPPVAAGEDVASVPAADVILTPVEGQFDYDQVKYLLSCPPESKLKSTQSHIFINAGPRFNMSVQLGTVDFESFLESLGPSGEFQVLARTSNSLIVRRKFLINLNPVTEGESVVFLLHRTLGYRDFTFLAEDRDFASSNTGQDKFTYSVADCKAMMLAAEGMQLGEKLPDDPAAILERFGTVIHRDDDVVRRIVLSPIRTTAATLSLLNHFPTTVELDARLTLPPDVLDTTLTAMPDLKVLKIADANIKGSIVPNLKANPHLKELEVGGTFIGAFSGQDLKRLGDAQELESLTIGSSEFTGSALAQIPILPHLKELKITKMLEDPVEGAAGLATGLSHLAKFPELRKLDLSQVVLSAVGLQGLSALTALTELQIQESRLISGANLAPLKSLETLEVLQLYAVDVDDTAVATLSELKSLKRLWIRRTKLTNEGYEMLKSALPGCEVDFK